MSGVARDLWVRVALGDAGTLVPTAAPVRIQQQLEGAVTTVAEVTLAGFTPVLATNEPVTIHHVNRNNAPEPDYESRQLFGGIVNRIGGVGSPHGVTLSCTGELAKLRRTRTHEFEYSMNGKTDIEVVRDVLDWCEVAYDPADIWGWDYELGRFQDRAEATPPLWWHAGQSGASIIGELDRVFACATIERNDGTVVRFPYSRSPEDYVDPPYTKTFARGRAGASFYGNERDRGDLDRVQNFWVVRGLGFSGAEGDNDEGCQFWYQASALADHGILGAGVAVGPQEFSSELIDSEELAKAIAERLMRWHNREPDLLRIQCGNDARLAPGHIILVRDATYGIDVPASKRYLVLAVARDGDEMLLDCVGGPPGATGAVQSHLYRDCNDTQTDVGTDPPPFAAPDPTIPDIPDIGTVPPDLPEIEEPPEPPNTDDLFIDCTEAEGMFVGPFDPLADRVPWRFVSDAWVIEVDPDADGAVTGLATVGPLDTLFYNTTPAPDLKTTDNDVQFDKNEVVTVHLCGTMYHENSWLTVWLAGPGFDPGMKVDLYTEPGYTVSPNPAVRGIMAHTEIEAPLDGPAPDFTGYPKNDGYAGTPLAAGSPFTVDIAFDPAAMHQRVQVAGEFGATLRFENGVGFSGEPLIRPDCDHDYHELVIQVTAPVGAYTLDAPTLRLTCATIGAATCAANPDYEPPETEDF